MMGLMHFKLLIIVITKKKPTMTISYPRHKKSKTRKRKRLKKHNQSRRVEEEEENEEEVVKVDQDEVVKAPVRRHQKAWTPKKNGLWLKRIFLFLNMVKSGPLNDDKNSGSRYLNIFLSV